MTISGSVLHVAFLDLNTSFVLQSKLPATGGFANYSIGAGRTDVSDSSVEKNHLDQLTVYPNPVNGKFVVIHSAEKIREISIWHANGTIMHAGRVEGYETTVDVSEWSKGLYLVKALLGNGSSSSVKLMK